MKVSRLASGCGEPGFVGGGDRQAEAEAGGWGGRLADGRSLFIHSFRSLSTIDRHFI